MNLKISNSIINGSQKFKSFREKFNIEFPENTGLRGATEGLAPHDLDRYQKGEAICAYICNPDEIVGKHHWIWYDFKTCQPRCELTPPPADRYTPDVFPQHTASSKVASNSQSQGVGITLSSPSFRGGVKDDQGFAWGDIRVYQDYNSDRCHFCET